MKLVLTNISNNEIIPDENFLDYGTLYKLDPVISKHKSHGGDKGVCWQVFYPIFKEILTNNF